MTVGWSGVALRGLSVGSGSGRVEAVALGLACGWVMAAGPPAALT
jgi:hypothetical protein